MNKQQAQKEVEEMEVKLANLKTFLAQEEKKTNKNWRAKNGRIYFSVGSSGEVCNHIEEGSNFDDYLYNTLNYFRTKEEAQAYKDKLLAIGRVTRAINETNGDWEADWNDNDQRKYYVECHNERGLDISSAYTYKEPLSIPHMKSKEITGQIIKDHKEDLELIFK